MRARCRRTSRATSWNCASPASRPRTSARASRRSPRSGSPTGKAADGLSGRRLVRAHVDLEPDVRAALVGAPARRELLNEVQAPTADLLEVVVALDGRKSRALVGDLGAYTAPVGAHLQADRAVAPVLHAVRDQLAHEQAHVRQYVCIDLSVELP